MTAAPVLLTIGDPGTIEATQHLHLRIETQAPADFQERQCSLYHSDHIQEIGRLYSIGVFKTQF